MSLPKDHNAVTLVRLEPAAPQSRGKHSTTEPLRSLNNFVVTHRNCHICELISKRSCPGIPPLDILDPDQAQQMYQTLFENKSYRHLDLPKFSYL